MRLGFKGLVALIWILTLAACTSNNLAPVRRAGPLIDNQYYVVQKGDTLYSIAFRYGFDFQALATLNNLDTNYTIFPGQRIYFSQQKKSSKSVTKSNKRISKRKSVAKTKPKSPTTKPKKQTAKTKAYKPLKLTWQWPIKGKLLEKYSLKHNGNKGIDIAAKKGQTVRAASAGIVVYCGTGLRGYGKLVIIKHSDDYLSAYAHNSKILVKEQQQVAVGEAIAVSGSSGTNQNKLHFEIRYKGKPVNPLKYLPQ